jgi:acylphosphatase
MLCGCFFQASRACGSDKITRLQMPENPVHEVKEPLQARRFRVSGTVQGVGFRYFASRMARQLGIAGYAKNLRDGRVEVYAIGTPEKLAMLRKELQRGPRSAVVLDVTEEDAAIEPKFGQGFSIERDSLGV